jgi:hypothetical protein
MIRQPRTTIHILDNYSLLNIFSLFRPNVVEKDRYDHFVWDIWVRERWWYKLVKVCRRWRCLILASPSYLDLCLLCTPGTPVAEMLEHSPSFPLVIYYYQPDHNLAQEDEEGLMHALQHRDRVQRIFLRLSVPSLHKLVTFIDDEFPALEFLHIGPPTKHETRLTLPMTFEAPHLRRLWLNYFASPIGSPFLTTAIGLVELSLLWIHPSTYPHPNNLLQPLSLLSQLETIRINFRSPVPNRDMERQILHIPVNTRVTWPNLRWFDFEGVSAYFEALLPHMTAPILQEFCIQFFNQLSFSIPHLLPFMRTSENLKFNDVILLFCHKAIAVWAYPPRPMENTLYNFHFKIACEHLDWQVSSVAQIFNVLCPLFSDVVSVILDYRKHTLSSEWHNQADRTRWRELLGSFRGVKTLRVHMGLVAELSRSLRLDGEPPLEILPELKELVCPAGTVDDNTFAAFIHDREVTGHPVSLIERAFPVGRRSYALLSSTGITYVDPDSDPLP